MWSRDDNNPLGKKHRPFKPDSTPSPRTNGLGLNELGNSSSEGSNRRNDKDTGKVYPVEVRREKQNLRRFDGLGNRLNNPRKPWKGSQEFPGISAAVRRRVEEKTNKTVEALFDEFLYNLRNDDSTFNSVASRLADDLNRLHDRLDNAA